MLFWAHCQAEKLLREWLGLKCPVWLSKDYYLHKQK